jgi:hypothetical protein
MSRRRIHKRMYAVSKNGVGVIAGTMAYSRRAAIQFFSPVGSWEMYKRAGYRTVMAKIALVERPSSALSSKERA